MQAEPCSVYGLMTRLRTFMTFTRTYAPAAPGTLDIVVTIKRN